MTESAPNWSLYVLRCADGSLYTGISTDVARRLREHEGQGETAAARGAKALRGKQPLQLVFQQVVGDQSTALKLEYKIKRLSKTDKEALVQDQRLFEAMVERLGS